MERNRMIFIFGGITSVLVVLIVVAFAALASNLNISFGEVTQNALTWNVGFKESSVTPTQEGTSNTGLSCGSATVTPTTITISNSKLSKPDDKCTYPLTINNKGDLSAILSNISAIEPTGLSCTITNGSKMVCGNITYELQNTSGSTLSTGITINANESYNVKLVVKYTGTELSDDPITQSNAKFTMVYTQSSRRVKSESVPDGIVKGPVCKRATTLHTEECIRSDGKGCKANGYTESGSKGTTTITYGSLGTSGTLTSGDAFDCDVNDDGIYNSETERFYYVSGLDGKDSSQYAVLIYYTNVAGGEPHNTRGFAYNSDNVNNLGPTTAYLQLPSTEQWPSVELSNQTRQIYTYSGKTATSAGTLPLFTYTDRAARLLSYKEANKGCNLYFGNFSTGELSRCEFIMEHSGYSSNSTSVNSQYYWLENPNEYYSNKLAIVYGENRAFGDSGAANFGFGVRPVIEVLKTDIDY